MSSAPAIAVPKPAAAVAVLEDLLERARAGEPIEVRSVTWSSKPGAIVVHAEACEIAAGKRCSCRPDVIVVAPRSGRP